MKKKLAPLMEVPRQVVQDALEASVSLDLDSDSLTTNYDAPWPSFIPRGDVIVGEIWKPVLHREFFAEVSNWGHVRLKPHFEIWGDKIIPVGGYFLKQTMNKEGYPYVNFRDDDGYLTSHTVHSLVAEAFLGPRPKGLIVLHINSNPADPSASNLKYGTHKENSAMAKAVGATGHGGTHRSGEYVPELGGA